VYDSVSYGMVDNLGRSDEWLGIIWLGSGEARCLWETSTTRVLCSRLRKVLILFQVLPTLGNASLALSFPIQQNEL